MRNTWLLLVILLLGSNHAAGQSSRAFGHGKQVSRGGFAKGEWRVGEYAPASSPSRATRKIGSARGARIPGIFGPHEANHGVGRANRCEGSTDSWSGNRPARIVGNSPPALGLEEYLRNAKLREKERANQPTAPAPDGKKKLLLWLAVGAGGVLLATGIILWLIFRIKIPPCPKCQNANKKTLRVGESCRTPSNFWVKCYCDACGYKWIQKGRRA